MTTVVVIDDDTGFRNRVCALLIAGGFEVVGRAADVATARVVVARQRPDLALIDIGLPDGDGLGLTAELTSHGSSLRVVVMSGRDRADFGPRILDSGATGFIHKKDLTSHAVHALAEGAR
ncbi:response regulator [Nocardioides limicola]|uniref:response regulator n=1 Tax=Nocardioides limicola TaxID=2803368 RepID=UPI00193BA6EA|nr:response regulator transcription factor [Nocardioides sp. DJM-14]